MVFQEFLASVGCRPLLQPTSTTTNSSHTSALMHVSTYIEFHNTFVNIIPYFTLSCPILYLVIPGDWQGTKRTVDIHLQCLPSHPCYPLCQECQCLRPQDVRDTHSLGGKLLWHTEQSPLGLNGTEPRIRCLLSVSIPPFTSYGIWSKTCAPILSSVKWVR